MAPPAPPPPSNPRGKAPYSDEELRAALASLVADEEGDGEEDSGGAAHLLGHPSYRDLSMLQVITATRILDYRLPESRRLELEGLAANDRAASPPEEFAGRERSDVLDLRAVVEGQAPRMALAAEFKRSSPSKGRMLVVGEGVDAAADSDAAAAAAEQAVRYAEAGACVVSVLTEPRWFEGGLRDLYRARAATQAWAAEAKRARPAVLRKDFVVSEEIVDEAVRWGADTVLLIVAVLPLRLLRRLIDHCRSRHGMEPLVEVHADRELRVALDAGAEVIGVNNRDLHTFRLDLGTSARIASLLLDEEHRRARQEERQEEPREHRRRPRRPALLCALSGLSTAGDVDACRRSGIRMCLVGESLMRSPDPRRLIAGLCLDPDDYRRGRSGEKEKMAVDGAGGGTGGGASGAASASAARAAHHPPPAPYSGGLRIVKVCGITSEADAAAACRAGAGLVGVIFAPSSPRKVSVETARTIVLAVRAYGERGSRLSFDGAAIPSRPLAGEDAPPSSVSVLDRLAGKALALADATRRTPAVVGVFQDQDAGFIRSVVDGAGLDLVQLHGREGMAAASASLYGGVPAIRVVDVPVGDDEGGGSGGEGGADIEDRIVRSVTDDPIAILLDTSVRGKGGGGGGTGRAFDWAVASRVQARGLPVIVAGGLTPDNVAECCSLVRPLGVDASSGLERSQPGVKDHEKVARFVREARREAGGGGPGGGAV